MVLADRGTEASTLLLWRCRRCPLRAAAAAVAAAAAADAETFAFRRARLVSKISLHGGDWIVRIGFAMLLMMSLIVVIVVG